MKKKLGIFFFYYLCPRVDVTLAYTFHSVNITTIMGQR